VTLSVILWIVRCHRNKRTSEKLSASRFALDAGLAGDKALAFTFFCYPRASAQSFIVLSSSAANGGALSAD